MIDIKKILTDNGVSGEVVDTIADTIKAEIPKEFVSKAQYNKKVAKIDELNNTIADLEAEGENDTSKKELEELKAEYDKYKNSVESEKTNAVKVNAIKKLLNENGVKNEKLANLLIKEIELDKIEFDEDKNIKGVDDLIKPIKENYGDFFSKTTIQGNPPTTPPNGGNNGSKYTFESLKGMTAEQIKANYQNIQKDLINK